LDHGDLSVVVNCMILCEGWDQPDVSCLIVARPTKSLGLYRQMAGRVLRPAPGKTDALILDHAGATIAHGFAEDRIAWALHEDDRATNASAGGLGGVSKRELTTCPKCSAIRTAGEACRFCGWEPRRKAESFAPKDGDLERLHRDGSREAVQIDRHSFFQQLRTIAAERGWKPAAPAAQYREKFGMWPPRSWNAQAPQPASPEVRSWVKSRMIAYAKRQSA
jgi:superfamily II DNA or RNA helicase